MLDGTNVLHEIVKAQSEHAALLRLIAASLAELTSLVAGQQEAGQAYPGCERAQQRASKTARSGRRARSLRSLN